MAETRTYKGGCHCRNVRYRVATDLAQVIECNCSICSRTGSLLTFVAPDRFHLESGGERLSDYQFASRTIHHLFCPTCGIRSFGRGTGPDGREMVAINVRCLEGVEPRELSITPFDGRSL